MTRKYICNDNYFSTLTQQNSYWGGFIAADGNIDKYNNRLTISLAIKDKIMLERFLSDLNSNYKIYYSNNSGCIIVSSKQIVNDLKHHFNITPAKSYTLQPPNLIELKLIDSYIIGLIDGDGSIGFQHVKNKRDRFYISLVGTPEVLLFVKQRFEQILGHTTSNLHFDKKFKGNTCTFRISDETARIIFLHYYNINIQKMERKWSKEKLDYCLNFKKTLPICRRKGVNVFDIHGTLIKSFATLKEASDFTGVSIGRISSMCKLNDGKHVAHDYMFSRSNSILPYCGNEYDHTSKYKQIK